MPRSRAVTWLLVLYLGFWGGAIGVLAKWALVGLTPIQLITGRLVISCALFAAMLLGRGELGKTLICLWRDKAYYAFLALVGVGGAMVLGFMGLARTTAISWDLLVNTSGLLMVVFSSVLYGDRVSRLDKVLLMSALVGVALIVGRNGSVAEAVAGGSIFGDILTLSSAIGWALYTVVGGKTARVYDSRSALKNVFGSFLLASLVLVPYVCVFEPVNWSVVTWQVGASTLVLSVFATALLFVLWFRFVENSGGIAAALVSLSENLSGVFLPILFLGEGLTPLVILGAILVIAPLVIREYLAKSGAESA